LFLTSILIALEKLISILIRTWEAFSSYLSGLRQIWRLRVLDLVNFYEFSNVSKIWLYFNWCGFESPHINYYSLYRSRFFLNVTLFFSFKIWKCYFGFYKKIPENPWISKALRRKWLKISKRQYRVSILPY
jgi:hypothetical protein